MIECCTPSFAHLLDFHLVLGRMYPGRSGSVYCIDVAYASFRDWNLKKAILRCILGMILLALWMIGLISFLREHC
jgi:hypothetical protein